MVCLFVWGLGAPCAPPHTFRRFPLGLAPYVRLAMSHQDPATAIEGKRSEWLLVVRFHPLLMTHRPLTTQAVPPKATTTPIILQSYVA